MPPHPITTSLVSSAQVPYLLIWIPLSVSMYNLHLGPYSEEDSETTAKKMVYSILHWNLIARNKLKWSYQGAHQAASQ